MEGGGREGGEEGVGGDGKGRERLGGGGGMNTGRCMCGINYDTHARKVSIAVCATKDDVIINTIHHRALMIDSQVAVSSMISSSDGST